VRSQGLLEFVGALARWQFGEIWEMFYLFCLCLFTSGALVQRLHSVSSSARIDSQQQHHVLLTLNGSVAFRSQNYEYLGLDCSGILLLSTTLYYISLWNLEPYLTWERLLWIDWSVRLNQCVLALLFNLESSLILGIDLLRRYLVQTLLKCGWSWIFGVLLLCNGPVCSMPDFLPGCELL
jgi:hypothetical protein